MDALSDCNVETNEDIERKLLEAEAKLADKLKLPKDNIRDSLIHHVKTNDHGGDELLEEWLELYSTFMYWSRRDE